MKKLRQRIKDNEIVVLKTDKSGRLTLMNRDNYYKLGVEDSKGDRVINREEMRNIEKRTNEHMRLWCKITNAGESHDHFKRIVKSKTCNSELSASKYLMYKDHKSKDAYRPVVSGCSSNSLGLSNLLSDLVESLCLSVNDPFEVISAEDMLAQFEEFNRDIEEKIAAEPEYDWRRDYLLLGTDVVSLFPSLSAENTAHAVRKQAERSQIK